MTTPLLILAEAPTGIEVLSLNPWMYGALLVTAFIGLATAILTFLQSWKNGREVKTLEQSVNGRLQELLEQTCEAALRLGHLEGVTSERDRGDSSRVQELIETTAKVAELTGLLKGASVDRSLQDLAGLASKVAALSEQLDEAITERERHPVVTKIVDLTKQAAELSVVIRETIAPVLPSPEEKK